MKPTHILVPIDHIDEQIRYMKSIGLTIDPIDEATLNTLKTIKSYYPKVDLSEEGIKEKANAYIIQDDEQGESSDTHYPYSREGAKWFYQQCAKDLLNTKP